MQYKLVLTVMGVVGMIAEIQGDLSWLNWTSWSSCNANCGRGRRYRTRTCSYYGVDQEYCGIPGSAVEREMCKNKNCPSCDLDGDCYDKNNSSAYRGLCNNATHQRACQAWNSTQSPFRPDTHPDAGLESNFCRNPNNRPGRPWCYVDGSYTIRAPCQIPTCNNVAEWKNWREWSSCSKRCHGGIRTRVRKCRQGFVNEGNCTGPVRELQRCGNSTCLGYCGDPVVSILTEDYMPFQKVVGGYAANKGSLPWMVLLLESRNLHRLCGGSIISKRWILTAGHCIVFKRPRRIIGVIGSYDENYQDEEVVFVKFSRFVVHPSYDDVTLAYDIGLLKTRFPLAFNDFVKPICLPSQAGSGSLQVGQRLLIAGWGYTGIEIPTILQQAYVPVVNFTYCDQQYTSIEDGPLHPGMFCAGFSEGGIDTCYGDSGGPVIKVEDYTQLGIVSWGYGCAQAGFPGVYTGVSFYRNWIDSFIQTDVGLTSGDTELFI